MGAGSGGCAVAGRLSEDAATSVALLDAGGRNDNWRITTPFGLALPYSAANWAFETVPQKGLNGRIGYQPRGKGLGGSSAINAMVYIRGHKWDYDHWASLGNAGWSYDDVLPYFKRSENNSDFDGAYHGKGGPLHVNRLRSENPIHEVFHQAAREAQFRIREDFNAEEQEGLGSYQVTQKNGERWSAARAYLQPHIEKRANLQRRDGSACHENPVRRRARGRHRICAGQADQAAARPPRGDPRRRRLPVTAIADAVGRRRRRCACRARHRRRASFAGRRAQPAGPSGFRVRLRLRLSALRSLLARSAAIPAPRASSATAASDAA